LAEFVILVGKSLVVVGLFAACGFKVAEGNYELAYVTCLAFAASVLYLLGGAIALGAFGPAI
jgi:hypothetical protein